MARPLASRGFVGAARDGGSGSRGGSERPPLPPSPAARGPGSCPCSERPSHRGRDSLFGKQPGTAEHRVNSEPCSNHDSFCPPNPPGRVRERMEPESSRGLQQLPTEGELPPGEKKKYLAPASRKDPRFEELQQVLMEWINATLLPEHIVARSLEEDLFDGLILHHLFQKLAALRLEVEEMALTSASQQRKLAVVLDAVNRSLQVEERQVPWSVEGTGASRGGQARPGSDGPSTALALLCRPRASRGSGQRGQLIPEPPARACGTRVGIREAQCREGGGADEDDGTAVLK
uniref:Calponin-homology (CH) domain-containing protein n=1 Tax=Oryctolagus cuniculus TaxID=9986 RepID=G1TZQ8_RABIT